MRENIPPVREQHKCPVRKLSRSPVREDYSPVRVTSKTGKKRQGESNNQEKQEQEWWLENTEYIEKTIAFPSVDFEYFCDSSSYSWGAHYDTYKICGAWNLKEKALHINCKELLAVYYTLRSFKTYFQSKHVKIFSDSHVGIRIINKMETTKSLICNDIVKNIWLL